MHIKTHNLATAYFVIFKANSNGCFQDDSLRQSHRQHLYVSGEEGVDSMSLTLRQPLLQRGMEGFTDNWRCHNTYMYHQYSN